MRKIIALSGTILKFLFLVIIRIYKKLVSPFFGRNCVYYPTCSEYMSQCLHKHGFWAGTLQGFSRILRCTSVFFKGGVDPVPESVNCRDIKRQWKEFKKK